MNLKLLLTIYTVVFGILGAIDIIAPEKAGAFFVGEGYTLNETNYFMIRLAGILFLSSAVMTWLLRRASLSYGRHAVLVFLVIFCISADIFHIYYTIDGMVNSKAWLMNVIVFFLAIGFTYYLIQENKGLKERSE